MEVETLTVEEIDAVEEIDTAVVTSPPAWDPFGP
jgi:hypothetical protein